uniref:Protein kinase domain-containing protein n=1 Tax=Oryzias melastigma TaxID=30732 RepID=A0A3B3D4B4_ORYME
PLQKPPPSGDELQLSGSSSQDTSEPGLVEKVFKLGQGVGQWPKARFSDESQVCMYSKQNGGNLIQIKKGTETITYNSVLYNNIHINKVAIKILKSKYKDAGRDEIQCIDWFRYKSHICIAFEILDKSLDDFMSDRDDRPLDLHEIRTIAWQLLIALQGLKNINLVHGDIKLDNIMLVNQVSEPFRVKLIDFGLAQKTSHIQTGSRMQNLLFRAPEVMLGLPLDERLDMWTVGYVLAMLGERVEEHLDYFSFDDLRDVYYDMTKRDEVEQFIDLLKRMLEVDPNKRISPSEAFEHPFFTMKSVQPSAGSEEPKPEEPAAPELPSRGLEVQMVVLKAPSSSLNQWGATPPAPHLK